MINPFGCEDIFLLFSIWIHRYILMQLKTVCGRRISCALWFHSCVCSFQVCVCVCVQYGLLQSFLSNLSPWRQNAKDKLHREKAFQRIDNAAYGYVQPQCVNGALRTHVHNAHIRLHIANNISEFPRFFFFLLPLFSFHSNNEEAKKNTQPSILHVADIFHSWHLFYGIEIDLHGERKCPGQNFCCLSHTHTQTRSKHIYLTLIHWMRLCDCIVSTGGG